MNPIYKKDARNRGANYRPVSFTSIVCSIMEKFVKVMVLGHLTNYDSVS